MIEVNRNILKEIYINRKRESKKYDFGILIVIGGSDFYSGSPALSALAGFRTGVDMVRVIAPKRAADIIASFSPVLASYPLEGKWLERKHLSTLLEMTKAAEEVSLGRVAVVVGGGAGRSKETMEVITDYLSQISLPVVIDADAIHAVAEKPDIISGKPFLITPHTYEFFILTGKKVYHLSEKEKIEIVKEEAAHFQTTILLKGPNDIISNGREVALSKTGTPLMTVGGCGDTLAGICGALMARKINPFLAGEAGAFINGRAGEIAGKRKKDGLLPVDIIDTIPDILP